MSSLTTEEKANLAYYYLKRKFPDFEQDQPIPPEPPIPPVSTKPTEGFVKVGGWVGADLTNREGWKIVNMKDRPTLFKITDAAGKNIATDFSKEVNAEAYKTYYKSKPNEIPESFTPVIDNENPEVPPIEPGPEPTPTPTGDGPYPGTNEMQSTQRGPTTRHYASGKPDDQTIEKNVKGIKFDNYQFLVDVKITTIEHDDTCSLKYGGTHMGSGWFDNSVGFKDGLVGLGTEKKHPSADLNIIKGNKIGSILNKKISIAGIYFKKLNKCEMWTNLGDGWKKQVEGVDVGGFNPKSAINEAQLRIDGFEDVPEITRAVVQEIQPPTPTPSPNP